MRNVRIFPLAAICVGLMSACGGGGGGDTASNDGTPNPTTKTLNGVVADGYLKGAKVCLDSNNNGRCDTHEPSATSGDNGAYEMNGVSVGDELKYPLLVEVPASAVDKDNGQAVGRAFFMQAPAGQYAFVSPLTTLVQARIAAGSSAADAEKYVKETLIGISDANVSLSKDYMTMSSSADYAKLHDAAKVVAASMQEVYGSFAATSDRASVQKVLSDAAAETLAFQKSSGKGFKAENGLGTHDDLASLQRRVAAAGVSIAATQDVSIQFGVVAGTQSVACGASITLNNTVDHTTGSTKATTGQIKDLRFYVSNVALIDAQGNQTFVILNSNDNQAYDVALLDFENAQGECPTSTGTPATYTTITGKVPPGNYVGLALTLGTPVKAPDSKVSLNHSDTTAPTTPALLQFSSMAWNWQGGRKFTKIEFTPTGGVTWPVHLGSTGCNGVKPSNGEVLFCSNPNRGDYVFAAFNSSSQKIVLDLDELFRTSDVTFNGGGSKGCMSSVDDPECPAVFTALGIDLKTGMTADGTKTQKIFSVRAK